ncbi:hypothetical protein FHS90_002883 [Rufibacter quisquiliarum]|uniref:TonB-dependent receptor plug domain-containing protein n=1 Tax=Rufibacter quisquiliarum TaxID=1549639 RepID=A0A839GMW8_9BACT|nr:hypothetical protein [Rufibacter quisquiliarum]
MQQEPLERVLNKAFEKTDFQFAIDPDQRVFVVKGPLQASLPPGYFSRSHEQETEPVSATYPVARSNKIPSGSPHRLYEIGIRTNNLKPGKATISGIVTDAKTGQPVIGAVVMIEIPLTAANTDQSGFYALTLPRGRHVLKIKSVGQKEVRRQVMLYSDGKLNVQLQEDVVSLNEVLVRGDRDKNVSGLNMGVEKLSISTIKQVPTVFGEADVMKVVLTLPGVKSVGESSTGLNVRGGATDQNLILFGGATIYNPSHLFGFFSAFNPDVVKGVELYKNSIPAKFGGRLASVLDISNREGNKQKFSGAGGLGLISSRLMLEGPIIKNKSSFLIGGRTTYSDWLLKQLPNETLNQSKASFYDLNANVSHQIDSSNSVSVNGYLSNDRFRFGSDTVYHYSNKSAILKWQHTFHHNFFGELSAAYADYQYSVVSEKNPTTAFELTYKQQQTTFKVDFNNTSLPKHAIDFGGNTNHYKISPGNYTPRGTESLVKSDKVAPEQALESALYLSDEYEFSPRFAVSLGLRYSFFHYLGPKDVISYFPGTSRNENSVDDTVAYGNRKVIKTYHGPEYRVSARFSLREDMSVKASYNRTRQYLHMLTNTAMMSPTDIWKMSDSYIQPQVGDQVSLGFFRNFKSNTIEASVEVYYKKMQHLLDYKSGAKLLLNHHIETDVINSEGKAYGVEVMLKKAIGKLNGWVSYTYSRAFLRSNDAPYTEKINKGEFYPSNFDKPHDVTLIGNYRFSRRISTSFNLTYSTGRPITLPMAIYELGGAKRIFYSERNQYRIPDYYRGDLSLNLEGGHKARKLAHSSWTFAIYNVTGRRNPYSVYFKSESGKIKGYQLSVFGQPIPTITYNFRF